MEKLGFDCSSFPTDVRDVDTFEEYFDQLTENAYRRDVRNKITEIYRQGRIRLTVTGTIKTMTNILIDEISHLKQEIQNLTGEIISIESVIEKIITTTPDSQTRTRDIFFTLRALDKTYQYRSSVCSALKEKLNQKATRGLLGTKKYAHYWNIVSNIELRYQHYRQAIKPRLKEMEKVFANIS